MTDGIRAVVLDWAGTMVDHGCRAPVIALQQVFAAAELPISEAEARADTGRAKRLPFPRCPPPGNQAETRRTSAEPYLIDAVD